MTLETHLYSQLDMNNKHIIGILGTNAKSNLDHNAFVQQTYIQIDTWSVAHTYFLIRVIVVYNTLNMPVTIGSRVLSRPNRPAAVRNIYYARMARVP